MERAEASSINRYFYAVVLYFFLWIILTYPFSIQEWEAGAAIAFIAALLSYRELSVSGLKNIKRIGILLFWYLPVFIRELIKANLHVAGIVLNPKMPIKPGFVKIKTNLKSPVARVWLANSITLTPGTLSVDIEDQYIYIHWITVGSTDVEHASEEIAGSFEKILEVMFK
ncbi:Na+/H+ antiporter subunit E [Athalassotoga saccharophila]|uniref:Na+/H+ antiporter subunit E n=1 Tax=Athalassotoga saccharophila TaxID=1441386 RepID=UPI00137AE855|nr:Na+/H+ antiporter subunit E [Athalassotoga saccharophila]BBJ28696.1 Na(+)/H(+) antiporter subunit E [Athalassotoga saccharophila]